jgi:negative regulator of flagellin synthesis FlgM
MKIDNNGISPLSSKPTDPAQRPERKPVNGEVSSVNQSRDKAELSDNARLLSKARTALENVPDVRADKVAQVSQQVQSGDYSIRLDEIARRLIGRVIPK